jgi:hypothetical protein
MTLDKLVEPQLVLERLAMAMVGLITPPGWKAKIPGITIPFFPRVYRDRKGMTYLECWILTIQVSASGLRRIPSANDNQLMQNAAGFYFVLNLLSWGLILALLWIGM